MQKYNIEDNIDFYSELNKLLNEEKSINKEEENICLISNEKLTTNFVKLNCGHCFNYIPLYKDLVNQKQKFNLMEITELKNNEIRCPYCRTKQTGVLPYNEELQLSKINGVNFVENEKKNLCEYSILNLNFNPMLPEDDSIGNGKYIVCLNAGSKIAGKNYGNDKHYCSYHKKIVIHYAKEEIKLLKLNQKEELKQQKLNKKLKASSTKNAKTENNVTENTIIQNNIIDLSGNIIILQKCNQKIKTGINKGKECGCKTFTENLCKRHYNLNTNKE
jgi:hypothetical protein